MFVPELKCGLNAMIFLLALSSCGYENSPSYLEPEKDLECLIPSQPVRNDNDEKHKAQDSLPDSTSDSVIVDNAVEYWTTPKITVYNDFDGYEIVDVSVKAFLDSIIIWEIRNDSIISNCSRIGIVEKLNNGKSNVFKQVYSNIIFDSDIPKSIEIYPDYVEFEYTLACKDKCGTMHCNVQSDVPRERLSGYRELFIDIVPEGKGLTFKKNAIIVHSNTAEIILDGKIENPQSIIL